MFILYFTELKGANTDTNLKSDWKDYYYNIIIFNLYFHNKNLNDVSEINIIITLDSIDKLSKNKGMNELHKFKNNAYKISLIPKISYYITYYVKALYKVNLIEEEKSDIITMTKLKRKIMQVFSNICFI